MSNTNSAAPWSAGITHLTLVTDDLQATRDFYRDVLELEPVYEDEASAAFSFGDVIVNALASTAAPSSSSLSPSPLRRSVLARC